MGNIKEKEKKEKIVLSNDGLSSFFERKEHSTIRFGLENGKFKITLEPNPYKNNGNTYSLKSEYTQKDVRLYLDKLGKTAEKNKILDTDKVFFTKNSVFPRTNFNRYSNKAKRIQSIDKADKIVYNTKFNYYIGNISGFVNEKDQFLENMNPYLFRNFLGNNGTSFINNISNADIKTELLDLNKYSTNYWGYQDDFNKAMISILKKRNHTEFKEYKCLELHTRTLIDQSVFEFLFKGVEISKIITDNCVNRYIDSFKTPLNKDNLEILSNALGEGDKNITMGLKLLENMNIKSNLVYFYSVFIICSKNSRNIINNSVWNSIGIKNLRENYGIEQILNNGYYSPQHTLSSLENVYTNILTKEEDKKEFKDICKDTILEALKKILSNSVFNVLKIKVE